MMADKPESTMTCFSMEAPSDLRVSPFEGARLLMGRWRSTSVPSSEIWATISWPSPPCHHRSRYRWSFLTRKFAPSHLPVTP